VLSVPQLSPLLEVRTKTGACCTPSDCTVYFILFHDVIAIQVVGYLFVSCGRMISNMHGCAIPIIIGSDLYFGMVQPHTRPRAFCFYTPTSSLRV
jgi:hypothetical protein